MALRAAAEQTQEGSDSERLQSLLLSVASPELNVSRD